jgi:hypothetical protein
VTDLLHCPGERAKGLKDDPTKEDEIESREARELHEIFSG